MMLGCSGFGCDSPTDDGCWRNCLVAKKRQLFNKGRGECWQLLAVDRPGGSRSSDDDKGLEATKSSSKHRTMQTKHRWNEFHDIGILEEAGTWSAARHWVRGKGDDIHVMYLLPGTLTEREDVEEAEKDVSRLQIDKSGDNSCFKTDQRVASCDEGNVKAVSGVCF